MKKFPYYVDDIIDIIDENEEHILYDYNARDDQLLIKSELRKKIFKFVDSIEDEKIDKKELVKFAIREAFELKDSDIVMIKQESIFIKLFDLKNKKEIPLAEQNTIANRFNGIKEEELKSFMTDNFSPKESKSFFRLVAKLFVERYFLGKHIDNQEYEKNVFSYIKLIIYEQLTYIFDDSNEFFKGCSGYIFRIHFKEVFENIAELMLTQIALSNDYMTEFLKYYSLDIVVVDGVKYRVPFLEAKNGLKWNVLSMLSIVKLYTKTKSLINETNHHIDKKEDEILKLYIGKLTPVEYNSQIIENKNKISDLLMEQERELDKFYDSFKLEKDEDKRVSLRQEIKSIKKYMQELRKEREEEKNKYIGKAEINKFLLFDKEIDTLLRYLKNEVRILEQNEESFNSIKNSLVKALTSKKQKL